MRSRKNKNELEGNQIIEGLEISGNFYSKNENRILTLLLKGIIVYLVTAGMLGGTITATGTEFNQIVFNVVVFLLSMIISLIYYEKKTENVGDILYLIMIIVVGVVYGRYINSGFYAWMNDVIGAAGSYFNLPDIGGYVQAVRNTRLAVTFASCYLGAVCVILVNMSIVKRMMYGDLILNSMIVLFLPVYLGLEPDYIYSVLLICGIAMSVIWKITGRYEKTDNNSVYIRKKKEITYTYSFKGHVFAFAQITVAILTILLAVYIILPKDTFSLLKGKSDSKELTDDIVETFITSGFAGFFNRYENTGGMSSGRLGGVNSVRLDYETDLIVTYAPTSLDAVYLRTFVGGEYHPYQNMWSVANPNMVNRDEYEQLKKEFEKGNPYSAKAKMEIENIDGETGEYALYYSPREELIRKGQSVQKTYYPKDDGIGAYASDISLTKEEREYWLLVPNDNVPSLITTIEKLGIRDDMDELEVAEAIRRYYYENIPYTLRPGSTPIRRDFVNYFLDSNKKGYCVHFASAATLLFRYMGIPARYVEGYAFDYNDISSAKPKEGATIQDYHEGYSQYDELPVISVEVSDASAHAWVEIYTEDYGWVKVELTPPSSDTEDSGETFFDRLLNLFNSGNEALDDEDNAALQKIDTAGIRRGLISTIVIVISLLLLYHLYRLITAYIVYQKADINTKLIIRYHNLLKRISKKNNLSNAHNYRDQIYAISAGSDDEKERYIKILERAGFSDKAISDEEFGSCWSWLKETVKKKRK